MQRRCPDCHGDSPRTIATLDAATIVRGNGTYRSDALTLLGIPADARFDVVSCARCGFVYARESLAEGALAVLYRDVIDAARAREGVCSPAWVAHQIELAAGLLRRLEKPGTVRVLDYGCGEGTIVRAVRGPMVEATGYEPYAASEDALTSMDDVRQRGPFDGIALSDVLEHVNDPRLLLRECRALLAEGGWLAVSVPLFNRARLREMLHALRNGHGVSPELNPWEHLNYFSPESLVRMVESEGFRVDAEPVANFGFRSGGRGLRRLSNLALSAARMIRFGAAPKEGDTRLYARRL